VDVPVALCVTTDAYQAHAEASGAAELAAKLPWGKGHGIDMSLLQVRDVYFYIFI